jgi:hypothetical protein
VNDGNDSNIDRRIAVSDTVDFTLKFYNTSIPRSLDFFDAPVVLTVNPGEITDEDFHRTHSKNLMFVRARTNMWNLPLVRHIVQYYSDREVPIILTFMAYFKESIPEGYEAYYAFRKRTLNSYWAITTYTWEQVMSEFKYNKWVDSCGKIEGEKGTTACRFCGNCLKHYHAAMEKRY